MLHGKFTSSDQDPIPLLSPDGKSIVVFNRSMIQLWHITPSGTLTQAPQRREDFVLDFLPDGPLAVVARQRDKTVTVLDLKSGVPWLSIDTPMEVCGVRLIGNTVAVIDGEVITWNLSGRNRARMTVEDSVQAINFIVREPGNVVAASISLDLRYVALLRRQNVMGLGLLVRHLYVTVHPLGRTLPVVPRSGTRYGFPQMDRTSGVPVGTEWGCIRLGPHIGPVWNPQCPQLVSNAYRRDAPGDRSMTSKLRMMVGYLATAGRYCLCCLLLGNRKRRDACGMGSFLDYCTVYCLSLSFSS